MSEQQVITVFGATGAQGGSLARALLADPSKRFKVRAVTRKPSGAAAEALTTLGAQIVVADFDDAASLVNAVRGADAAYLVTNFWEHFSADKELAQVQALANAVREAKTAHVIWSTLEDTRLRVPLSDDRMPTLAGRFKVPHFDAKGEANKFFEGLPVTLLHTSFYWDNLVYFGMEPKRQADGKLGLVLPMGNHKLSGIAAEDIGKCAAGVFARGKEFIGRSIGIAGEHLTGAQMAAQLSTTLGEPVTYVDVSPATYRGFGFPGADDLGNMFQYYQEFEQEFSAARDTSFSRSLNPELQSFADFLKKNAAKIPRH